jgi:hypothetical protein
LATQSGGRSLGSSEQWWQRLLMGSTRLVDGLARLINGFFIFYFLNLLTKADILTAGKNSH